MLPGYPNTIMQLQYTCTMREWADLPDGPVRLLNGHMGAQDIPILLLDVPVLFTRPGSPYLSAHDESYEDNTLRFAVFNRIAARVAVRVPSVYRADIVQAYDWYAGLVPLFAK